MISLLALAVFATWTLLVLALSVGIYRWSRILTGRVAISRWTADDYSVGGDFYYRAMRAHANCVENLPVFAVLVLAATASGLQSAWFDGLSVAVTAARIPHTLVHLSFRQTDSIALVRFGFYLMQLLSMLGMAFLLIRHLL